MASSPTVLSASANHFRTRCPGAGGARGIRRAVSGKKRPAHSDWERQLSIRRRRVTRFILIKPKHPAGGFTVPLSSGKLKRPAPLEGKMRAFEPQTRLPKRSRGTGSQAGGKPASVMETLRQRARTVIPSAARDVSAASPAALNQQKPQSGGQPRSLMEHFRAQPRQSPGSGFVPDQQPAEALTRTAGQSISMLDVIRVEGAIFSDSGHEEE
jgi:hypothetical protein